MNPNQVEARLNGFVIQALVDTAAEVTLVSDRVIAQLSAVGEGSGVGTSAYENCRERLQMNGSIVGPVTIQLGNMVFKEKVYGLH
ncbi:hypothetical protein DPMN_041310 [Dreissena polymorpha]|uniref:Uncharacterized protein n=1 Tax=Dreissena polymorpha TaxID=45954 RepID=A0A9D4HTT8_DREPO|nr:hypothetical protein DPMN_041310 [Dreissena polymorpha]